MVREDEREIAEAAQPPSAWAHQVLSAARVVHSAERALKAATSADDLSRLRYALMEGEKALRDALKRLSTDGTDLR